jgi:transcriptional regulator with XRE-family HTH domain
MPNEITFGQRLRSFRVQRKLPLREVAERAEISPAHLSKIENDESQPTLRVLERLADVFNVSLEVLATGNAFEAIMPEELRVFLEKNKDQYPELADPAWQKALMDVRLRGAYPKNSDDWMPIFTTLRLVFRENQ